VNGRAGTKECHRVDHHHKDRGEDKVQIASDIAEESRDESVDCK